MISMDATKEFFRQWRDPRYKLRFKKGSMICKSRGHKRPYGSYGSNDYWCLRCGILIAGPPRVGEM